MLQFKTLVLETLRSIDTRAARSISIQKVTTLNHEVLDHPVEPTALVALRPSEMVLGLASAVLAKVFCRARNC